MLQFLNTCVCLFFSSNFKTNVWRTLKDILRLLFTYTIFKGDTLKLQTRRKIKTGKNMEDFNIKMVVVFHIHMCLWKTHLECVFVCVIEFQKYRLCVISLRMTICWESHVIHHLYTERCYCYWNRKKLYWYGLTTTHSFLTQGWPVNDGLYQTE